MDYFVVEYRKIVISFANLNSHQSSCYLNDGNGRSLLMYQHNTYQIRSTGVIVNLRKKLVNELAEGRSGCSWNNNSVFSSNLWEGRGVFEVPFTNRKAFRGLTGEVIFNKQRQRIPRDFVLWSTSENDGLLSVARVTIIIIFDEKTFTAVNGYFISSVNQVSLSTKVCQREIRINDPIEF